MVDIEKTEVYTTEYIDKELPRVLYEKKTMHSMTESESTYISVSDKTSKAALDTFKELRREVSKPDIVDHLTLKPGGKEPGCTKNRWNIL